MICLIAMNSWRAIKAFCREKSTSYFLLFGFAVTNTRFAPGALTEIM
jgi:hypothetical protein